MSTHTAAAITIDTVTAPSAAAVAISLRVANVPPRILVVDDNPAIHDDFRKLLASPATTAALDEREAFLFGAKTTSVAPDDYDVVSAYQGEDGLTMVAEARQRGRPFSLVFLDVRMPPGWDGIETAEHILRTDAEIQVVLCTAYSDYSSADILRRLGKSHRLMVLKKPFDAVEAGLLASSLTQKWQLTRDTAQMLRQQEEYIAGANQVVAIIQNCQGELEAAHEDLRREARELRLDLDRTVSEISGTRDVTVYALAQLADSRDPETGEHLARMREFSQVLAVYLSQNGCYAAQIDEQFLEDFYRSTPLHDIGKVGIPDNILLKPGRLTPEEFAEMKKHTLIGAETLERAAGKTSYGGFLKMAADIARHHHEKLDGTGYPFGLRGAEIPLAARIVAVADVFDALSSARVYKDAMPPEEARAIIERDSGRHFDPVVVAAFQACFPLLLEAKTAIDTHRADEKMVIDTLAI